MATTTLDDHSHAKVEPKVVEKVESAEVDSGGSNEHLPNDVDRDVQNKVSSSMSETGHMLMSLRWTSSSL